MKNRVGEINYNTYGSKIEITEYINAKNITVKFENGYVIKNRYYGAFKKGNIKCPYDKSVYGAGYLGEGKYKPIVNGERIPQYKMWECMLRRVYQEKFKIENPTYEGCSICEEWHNFQNFAKWYDENYYEIDGEHIQLDKDILVKGNKTYSPKTCLFVPQSINLLFIRNDKDRGKFPIGVNKSGNRYYATTNYKGKQVDLGNYNSVAKAFDAYKIGKENIIKRIADEYQNRIPKNVYDALYNYRVDITD